MRFPVVFSALLPAALFACGDNSAPEGALEASFVTPAGQVSAGPTVKVRVRLHDPERAPIVHAVLSAGSRGVVVDLARLDAEGELEVPIDLPEGRQELVLAATTSDGRTATAASDLVVDSTAPLAQILSPAASAIQLEPTFAVRVRVTDAIGLQGAVLQVGEAEYPIAPHTLDGAGEATIVVTAPAGASHLSLRATDRAGHQSTARSLASVDLDVPAVELRAPRAGAAETRRLLFAELADEGGIAEVRYSVNGGAARVLAVEGAPAHYTLREALDLAPGENQLELTITDRAGRSRVERAQFRYGLTATAGGAHSGAIVGGQLTTWGRYNVGQLGLGGALGDAQSRLAPELVPAFGDAGTEVAAIAFNQNTSLALRSDRTVWTWGANADGQLGQGDLVQRAVPTQLAGLTDVVYASVGYSHVLALRASGEVIAWGRNAAGQVGVVGDGTTADKQPAPVVVAGLPTDIVEIVAGSEHSLALTADGRVFAWGRNQYGNLGQGSFDGERHPAPVQVAGLTDVIDLANGRDHVLALRADGTVMTWGLGASGQLGYGQPAEGAEEDRAVPVTALTAANAPLTGVTAVFANGNTSYALVKTATGVQLWGWGQNFSGQLATGATSAAEWLARRSVIWTAAEQPTYLDQIADLTSLGVGATHVIARAASGVIYAWGWSFRGSLGVPTLAHAWAQTIALEVTLPVAPTVTPNAPGASAP